MVLTDDLGLQQGDIIALGTSAVDGNIAAATEPQLGVFTVSTYDAGAKTDTLGAATVTVTSPVAKGGRLIIYQGDDYSAAEGRGIVMNVKDATHSLRLDDQEAEVRLNTRQVTWTATSVTTTADGYMIVFEPTSAETVVLTGDQPYELEATTAAGHIVTLACERIELIRNTGGDFVRKLARYAADLVLAALILLLLLAGPAEATHAEVFDITGGTQEQQDIIREALEESAWDWTWGSEQYLQTNIYLTPEHPPFWGDGSLYAAGREGETAFPYSVGRATSGVAYWPSGAVYIDSTIADPKMLRQIAMHEAAHARIMFVWFWDRPDGASMYDCYALDAWRDLIGTYGNLGIWTESPVESHAEWFRVTYLDTQLQVNVYPQTNLPGPPGGTADVVAFHDEWCPEPPNRTRS